MADSPHCLVPQKVDMNCCHSRQLVDALPLLLLPFFVSSQITSGYCWSRHCIGRCPGEPVTGTPAPFPPLSGLVWISHFVHAFAPRRTAETFLSAGGVRRHKLSTAPSGRMIGLMPLHFRIRGMAGYFPPRSLRRRPRVHSCSARGALIPRH